MRGHFLLLTLAIGAVSLNGAFAEAANEPLVGALAEATAAGHSSPGGNPLWGIPLSNLVATRERPLFSATRRAATLPPAPAPTINDSAPPPAAPEEPLLTLIGTATGRAEDVAVVRDQTSQKLVRLHAGEAISGWLLRSVTSRTITIEKAGRTVTLALRGSNTEEPGSANFTKETHPGDAS